MSATLVFHDGLKRSQYHQGDPEPFREVVDRDDFTRDLGAWARYWSEFDQATDRYCEVIELYDGCRIESVASLMEHRYRR
jgi:hypothetical protein